MPESGPLPLSQQLVTTTPGHSLADMGGKTYYRVLKVILAVLVGIFVVAYAMTEIRDWMTPEMTAAERQAETDRIVANLTPSSQCAASLAKAGRAVERLNVTNPLASSEKFDALELPPLKACRDAKDWMNAAFDNPMAVGFTHSDAIDESLLVARCNIDGAAGMRVCRDAAVKGMLD